jgi:oxygen-independent coproporphyrinogen III oxidase
MSAHVDEALLARLGESVPRYTSYPTAPHFADGQGPRVFAAMIANLPADAPVSVYLHIPFCDRLCWFCGCHTKHTQRYAPVEEYVRHACAEIRMVGERIGARRKLANLHLGGGSPSLLRPAEFAAIREALEQAFDIVPDAEIAIEIDPSDSNDAFLEGLKLLGVTRASIGVQDFNAEVQAAINRPQSFELTRDIVQALRGSGVGSVNIDALYGLPLQTLDTLTATIGQVLELQPDRVALFGYAHVPWVKKHQNMIRTEDLPGPLERFRQSTSAAAQLAAAGMIPVGIDHFARPGDTLAAAALNGTLRRNFQGYTTDACNALIGIGASSIHGYDGGFVQNIVATGQYQAAIERGELPHARGCERSLDDRMRGDVIERLMCDFSVAFAPLRQRYGSHFDAVYSDALEVAALDQAGWCGIDGERFYITPEGRPFTRIIASKFDAWLNKGNVRYSKAV